MSLSEIWFCGFCAQPATRAVTSKANFFMFISPVKSELISPQTTVDGNHGAGDIARPRRDEKAHEVREVLGLAVFAHRDVLLALLLPELGRIVAQDLLGDDAPRRHRVHGDAVLSDLARQALR